MDLRLQTVFSPSEKSRARFQLTEDQFHQLNEEQLSLLNSIFQLLQNKIALGDQVVLNEPNDRSKITQKLKKICIIIQKRMPSSVREMGKYNDLALNEEISSLINRIVILKNNIKTLKETPIEESLGVLANILVHQAKYRTSLEESRKEYGNMYWSYQNILEKIQILSIRIKARIASYKQITIDEKNFKLIVAAHDPGFPYLEKNLESYTERTEGFKSRLKELEAEKVELELVNSAFQERFCFLEYILGKFNVLATYSQGLLFSGWWKSGMISMTIPPPDPSSPGLFVSSPLLKGVWNDALGTEIPITDSAIATLTLAKPISIPFFNSTQFQKEEIPPLLHICNTILKKARMLEGGESVANHLDDPIFAPFIKIAHAWTPLKNHNKTLNDEKLTKSKDELIALIDTTTEKFSLLYTKYRDQIRQLFDPSPGPQPLSQPPEQNPPPLSLPTKQQPSSLGSESPTLQHFQTIENSTDLPQQPDSQKGINKDFPVNPGPDKFNPPNVQELRGSCADVRQKDVDEYAEISAGPLKEISKWNEELEEKIKQRNKAVKDRVSVVYLEMICQAHDITLDKLNENLQIYKEGAQNFEKALKVIEEKIGAMNTMIKKFAEKFDYFTYLYKGDGETCYQNTKTTQISFKAGYTFGYFTSIQTERFTTSSKKSLETKVEEKSNKGKEET